MTFSRTKSLILTPKMYDGQALKCDFPLPQISWICSEIMWSPGFTNTTDDYSYVKNKLKLGTDKSLIYLQIGNVNNNKLVFI